MSWELGYFGGLLTGASLAGLAGVFLHAKAWADWREELEAMTRERDAAVMAALDTREELALAESACVESDAIAADYQTACDRGDRLIEERDAALAECRQSYAERNRLATELGTAHTAHRATVADLERLRDAAAAELTGVKADMAKLAKDYDALDDAWYAASSRASSCGRGLALLVTELNAIRAGAKS